jgi:5-formyltetrahydrofolate cyclo-ligase
LNPAVEPIDPEAFAELRARAKAQLRQRMRALRKALPASALALRSEAIGKRLLAVPAITRARSVALFWPITGKSEVDLRSVDHSLRERGLTLFYPYMTPNAAGFETGFRRVDAAALLSDRGRGFAEPPAEAPRAERGEIDVVVVPALAVANTGHRIGYGLGFYDATLPDYCPPATSIVVAFGFQLLAELPTAEHDFRCDVVVTDEHVLDAEAKP